MTIFMVAEQNYDEWGRKSGTTLDPDYGYFTTEEACQKFIDEVMAPDTQRYEEARAQYEKKKRAWDRKAERLRDLGGVPSGMSPRAPDRRDFGSELLPEEVDLGRGQNEDGEESMLSRMLFDAREQLEMWADTVEAHADEKPQDVISLVKSIDHYRAVRGWSPDGFGGEG